MVFTAQRAQYGFQHRNSAIKSKLRHWKLIPTGSPQLWEAVIGQRRCECESSFQSFCRDVDIFHPSMEEGGGGC